MTSVEHHDDLHTTGEPGARREVSVPALIRAVDRLPEGLVLVQGGDVRFANAPALRMLGVSRATDLTLHTLTELLPAEYRSALTASTASVASAVVRVEVRSRSTQGRTLDLEWTIRPVAEDDDRGIELQIVDVSEQKNFEREQALWHWEQEALRDIDRQLVGVADTARILDSILQQAMTLVRADWAGVLESPERDRGVLWRMVRGSLTGGHRSEFDVGRSMWDLLEQRIQRMYRTTDPPGANPLRDLPGLPEEQLSLVVWSPLVVESRSVGALVVGYRHPQEVQTRDLRLLASLAQRNAIAMLNARLYESILARERDLELLSASRTEAQEEERRRIAKQIHDGIGQMLTAIKFNLEILEDSVQASDEDRSRIREMKMLLDNLMREAREMSYALMPSVLEDFGLVPALQQLCEQFGRRSGLRANFQSHGAQTRLVRFTEVSLYRIAQEALSNIARHAGATEVNVQVIHGSGHLRLVIEDNGKGIPADDEQAGAIRPGGLGIVGMRERAAQMGGTLAIDSTPGRGTIVSADLPLTGRTGNS